MSEVDRILYALFAQCCAAGLPLSNGLFADGMATKHELIAMLRAQLKEWLEKLGDGDEPKPK
jgi:hypothetical protein